MFMGLTPRQRREPPGILPFDMELTATVDEVTARAGLPLVLEMSRALEVERAVAREVHIRQRRAGYSEAEMVEAVVLLLAAGGECADDMATLGADKGLLALLGKTRLPSPDAVLHFLQAFHDEPLLAAARAALPEDETALVAPESVPLAGLGRVTEHVVACAQQQHPVETATLERDATIIESHKRDAVPHDKGGRGYQPEGVYWVEQDVVVADPFRDGNVPAGKEPLPVVAQAFAALPAGVTPRRFRADSAAYEITTLKWLMDPAHQIERFTVSADMSRPLRTLCEQVPAAAWRLEVQRPHETVWWSEVVFCPGEWPKTAPPLRTRVRKIEKVQGELFANGSDPRYLAVVSNDFAAEGLALLRWHYEKAGHIEQVHDVVKNDLGGGVLPCGAFGANAAWFRLCLLTDNILSLLTRVALPAGGATARPKRLRFAVFTLPGRVTAHARRLAVRVAAVLGAAIHLLAGRRAMRQMLFPSTPSG
jgi:hypothetical protein